MSSETVNIESASDLKMLQPFRKESQSQSYCIRFSLAQPGCFSSFILGREETRPNIKEKKQSGYARLLQFSYCMRCTTIYRRFPKFGTPSTLIKICSEVRQACQISDENYSNFSAAGECHGRRFLKSWSACNLHCIDNSDRLRVKIDHFEIDMASWRVSNQPFKYPRINLM